MRALARLDRPRGNETRLAVVADPHVEVDGHTEELFRRALADAGERGADAVLVVGDLTRAGRPAEFDAFDAAADALDVDLFCLPGNHDLPKAFNDHATHSLASFEQPTPPTRWRPSNSPRHPLAGVLRTALRAGWLPVPSGAQATSPSSG